MQVSPFSRSMDRAAFSCGIESLDRYLKHQLSQDIKKGVAAGFVLHDHSEIIGYYTLSALSIELPSLPESVRQRLPAYPQVTATLMGRLAIAQSHQGRGTGELLLLDALRRAWATCDVVASWAFCVDALGEGAVRFYEHYEFQRIEDTLRLFLPMKTIGKLFKNPPQSS